MKLLRRTRRARTLTTIGGRRPRLWLGTWPTDSAVGHLIVTDHEHTPSTAEIARAIDEARARGMATVRTGALFPDAASALLDHGFAPIDTLTLLQRDLAGIAADDGTTSPSTGEAPAIRRLRVTDDAAAAEVDQLAFGRMWGYDRDTVTEVRRATPAHRARRIGPRRHIEAYAISGAGDSTGYLQRLAVRPDRRRSGLASALVADSLRWMNARGLDSALVNTAADNRAALALYERFGFRQLHQQLTVAELRIGPLTP